MSGDVIVPKITPTFEGDRSTWVESVPTAVATGTTELHVVRPSAHVDGRYLDYLFSSRPFLEGGEAEMIGVAGQKRVPDDWIRDFEVPVDSVGDQRAIADYLDAETARIDALIAKKQQLIHLLEERWLIAIESELTGWSEVPLKRVACIDYGLGQPPKLSETGVPILRATNIERGRINPKNLIFASAEDLPLDRAPLLREGELLVVRSGAWTGDSALVTADWAGASPGYDLRVFDWSVKSALVAYQFLGERVWKQIDLVRSRAAQPHLNAEELGSILIRVPPDRRSEESALSRLEALDQLRTNTKAALTSQLGLLSEHRQASITGAVTGEFTVPGAA